MRRRLFAVHSDSAPLTEAFARHFLDQKYYRRTSGAATHEDKLPGTHRSLKTLLVETLTNIEERRLRAEQQEGRAASISAYNFNNGKSPQLEIYHLPLKSRHSCVLRSLQPTAVHGNRLCSAAGNANK